MKKICFGHGSEDGNLVRGNTNKTQSSSPVGKKGYCGNPSGRPKIPEEVKEAFREFTLEARNTLVEIMQDKEAKAGDRVRASEVILNRAWGTPEQSVAVSGGLATANVDTSKLPQEKQDALLDALVGVFAGNETDTTD